MINNGLMSVPLAQKMRPQSLDQVVGQEHILGKDKALRKLFDKGQIPSMILWGPPGTGKTTIARLAAKYIDADFVHFSAVTGGIADVKKIIKQAKEDKGFFQKDTILFVDEIHRFNKAQQDAFLPHVEDGTIILIGATTENPSFYVIAPLLSRSSTFKLEPLSISELTAIVELAIKQFPEHKWDKKAIDHIAKSASGDARAVINAVETAASLSKKITLKIAEDAIQQRALQYDKKGDNHYDTISAFIKSMRGGDADATLHYLARMIKAGEDPLFIARRMVIFASEDIGNARPNALVLATSCMQAVKMIGMPESQLFLAQTATYLATCPKSIASTEGIFSALRDLENKEIGPIPLHLRNAPTKLMKDFGYGKGHIRYPWKEEKVKGHKIKQDYLPENLKGKKYYKID